MEQLCFPLPVPSSVSPPLAAFSLARSKSPYAKRWDDFATTYDRRLLGTLFPGGAIEALLHTGFTDDDIDAVGVLSGSAFDVTGFLDSVGLPRMDAIYYSDCIQEGAVLLMIRTHHRKWHSAAEVVYRYGGMLRPSQ